MHLTRRDFLATSASAVAGALVWPERSFGSLIPPQEPVFMPIRAHVGYFTMRGGTVGYLVNDGAVVVVDTQFPAEAQALLAGLNERSGKRPVNFLINTHHHADHTGGNAVFRGIAKQVIAHEMAAEHTRRPPGGHPPEDQLFHDTTFAESWSAEAGDERVHARYYGRAHTSGDAAITFERANVVHMGDLVFNQRHPVVDRAAGASIRNWMTVLERAAAEHDADTIYIFGHANTGLPVTGDRTQLARFRDYFAALLQFVQQQVRAGRSLEEILAMREPLAGFETYGRFGQAGPRDALTCAYEEVTAGA